MIQIRNNRGEVVYKISEGVIELLTENNKLIEFIVAAPGHITKVGPDNFEALQTHANMFRLQVAQISTIID